MRAGQENITATAKMFLAGLHQMSGLQRTPTADDLLLFFYRLRDEYRIVRSTSNRFKGPSFAFLHELLYQLESRPDEALRSEEWRTYVEMLLSDIASDRIIVGHR
jgi:hypothetical protein